MIPNRNFGVEIEFIGVYAVEAARAISNVGIPCYVEGYNHSTRQHWKIVTDGSIQVNSNMDPGMCGELVSPPLSGENGIEQLRKVVKALAEVGGTVNKTCGLHVHVDANDLNAGQILSVVRRYAHFENEINSFMPPSRRQSRWAGSVGGDYVNNLLNLVNRYNNPRNTFGGLNRYMAVNLASYARHGTIEFRQHSGSTNATKISNWITFCLYFVNKAIQAQVLSTPSTSENVSVTSRTRRGRRPNYEARRQLLNALLNNNYGTRGTLPGDLAVISGYSQERLGFNGQIMNEIRTFANVYSVGYRGFRRIGVSHIFNQAMADVWLGLNNSTDPTLDARIVSRANNQRNRNNAIRYTVPMIDSSDTLFADMPNEIAMFYQERSSEFS